MFPDQTTLPDDYHSAQEPSESKYDSGGTDPDELEDDPKEDEDDTSMGSNSTYKSGGHDTDRTCRTNTISWNHRCNQRKGKENRDNALPMPRRRKIDVRARWCYLCSRTLQRKVP